ncbi:hypothetical protein GQX73_g3962 [Xylaria multiplex]|uniref:SRR1-like domain-containing protein n=1 Tax=Xylaria multiplex TaxID=323545 RepID=A0A7C8IQA3_9PEZI|nr:hypothetical protein GQX73_g3962 [Xylaria multiplex]
MEFDDTGYDGGPSKSNLEVVTTQEEELLRSIPDDIDPQKDEPSGSIPDNIDPQKDEPSGSIPDDIDSREDGLSRSISDDINSREDEPSGGILDKVLSRFLLPPTINKVVCFGLDNDIIGNPMLDGGRWNVREKREGDGSAAEQDDKWGASAFETNSQHLAAVSIKEYIELKYKTEIRLMAQNSAYTQDTMAILRRQGFEILGTSQIQGFLEVDENTVVISLSPNTCVKEILADLARPAVFITLPYHRQDLASYKMDWAGILMADDAGLFDPQTFFHNKLDYDTRRTRAMFREYYKAGPILSDEFHVLVGQAPRWTADVHVYIRKEGSTQLFPGDFVEESDASTEESDSDEFEDDEDMYGASSDENRGVEFALSRLIDENLRSYALTRRSVEERERRRSV